MPIQPSNINPNTSRHSGPPPNRYNIPPPPPSTASLSTNTSAHSTRHHNNKVSSRMAGSPPQVPQASNSSNTSGIGSSASSSTASGLGTTSVMSISNTNNSITTVADAGNKTNGNVMGDSPRMNTSGGGGGGGGGGVENTLSRTNLYIKGLPANTTDKNLYELCSPFGTITSTKAILEKGTNNCKGYGFVDFESPYSASAAVKQLQAQGMMVQMAKHRIDSSNLRKILTTNQTSSFHYFFMSTVTAEQEQDPTNLYIANLPTYMTENHLETMLAPYGKVVSTRILRDSNQQPRGVGFARMDSRNTCEVIINTFNNQLLAGCKEPLLVKFADGGNKKKPLFMKNDSRMNNGGWRDNQSAPVPATAATAGDQLGGAAAAAAAAYGYSQAMDQHHHYHHHHHNHPHAGAGNANSLSGATAAAQLVPIPALAGYHHTHHPGAHVRNAYPAMSAAAAAAAANAAPAPAWIHHGHHGHLAPAAGPGAYQLLQPPPQQQQQASLMDPSAGAIHLMSGLAAQMQHTLHLGHSQYGGNTGGNMYGAAGAQMVQSLQEVSDSNNPVQPEVNEYLK